MSQSWWQEPLKAVNQQARDAALARQLQLTKPAGSLGELENLAIQLAGLQGHECPATDKVSISIFAADHGIAQEGVSAFPQEVTAQMILNFAAGGAAISVLARQLNADFEIINLGTVSELPAHPAVRNEQIAAGTANFAKQAAMSEDEMEQAMAVGRAAAQRAQSAELFIAGEMGIANTSSATAVMSVLLDCAPAEISGPGTGLDAAGVRHKIRVIEQGIALHREHCNSPQAILACLGGFEIAAMVGAYIRCGQQGTPILVDGFIATSAALLACHLQPALRDWMIFAHQSAEPGHAKPLHALQAKALLDLGLRLGEGSGAAVAVPLLRLACALHSQMATFADAGVSDAE